jgi:hypothetical protein
MDNDLLELKDYLKKNLNINITIKKNLNGPKYFSLYKPTIDILILIIYIITLIIFYIYLEKLLNNFILGKIIYTILIIVILILFIPLLKCIFTIIYNTRNNNNNLNYKKLNINSLQTGDIIREKVPIQNSRYGYALYFFQFKYIHHIIVVKYNNKIYGLHFVNFNLTYPQKYLSFDDNPNMELFLLEDYLNDNSYYIKNYNLIKIKNPISTTILFNELKNILNLKIKFFTLFFPKISIEEVEKDNEYNCIGFILLILMNLKIIPQINTSTMSPDDLEYMLPELSKGLYTYEGSFSI